MPVIFPAATVIEGGTTANELSLASETTVPDGPDGPLKVTVPVDGLPLITLVGLSDKPVKVDGVMASPADGVPPLRLAVMFAVVEASTPSVVTVNVAAVWPKGTLTVAGTMAELLSLERVTDSPPKPAGPLSVTVPVEVPPAETFVGFRLRDAAAAGTIVRVVFTLSPGVALIIAFVTVLTATVFIVKVAVF